MTVKELANYMVDNPRLPRGLRVVTCDNCRAEFSAKPTITKSPTFAVGRYLDWTCPRCGWGVSQTN